MMQQSVFFRLFRAFPACAVILLFTAATRGQENPATIPVPQPGMEERHAAKVAAAAREKYDLVFIGNSITHNFEKPEFAVVWDKFYAPRHAFNLGYSGARTENILWNLQHGELEGQSPKVAVLLIGTNNADEKNYPTHHTAEQIAGGIEAIVKLLRERLPQTKLVLLRPFPYGQTNPNSRRSVLEQAGDRILRLADGKQVFYCDINHVFLRVDGTIRGEVMPDFLHPNPTGTKLWAQAMEPLLHELMGDASHDTDVPANTAIVPVPKLEQDSYDWWARHQDELQAKDRINPEVVLIGDSITHFWGGEPRANHVNGPKSWTRAFGNYPTLNLGFGWDRTQNVLWRLDHGEFDGLHPRVVVVHIGTNNTSGTDHARENTPAEIAEGIEAICTRIRSKAPVAKILLMAVFPREEKPDAPRRATIAQINRLIAPLGKTPGIVFLDIGPKLLRPDGTISRDIMSDFCHPTDEGYQIWADALAPLLAAGGDRH